MVAVSLSALGGAGWQFLDNSGEPLAGGFLYTYLAGSTTPATTYQSSAGSSTNTNPIVLDSYGRPPAEIWQVTTQNLKFEVTTSAAVPIRTYDNVPGVASAADLAAFIALIASSAGAANVGYNEGGASSVVTTLQTWARNNAVNAVADYGCDNTGATNTTTALKDFFDRCILTGKPGYIPPGTYKITPGVLSFTTSFTDKAWPHIYTAGYDATIFNVDSTSVVDAPIITITNGTATSAVGKYWRGGSLGGFSVTDSRASSTTYTNTHALSVTGMFRTRFGTIYASGIGGSGVYCPTAGYLGNPDPNANTFCYFEGIEVANNGGLGFYNGNSVGLNGCIVDRIRCVGSLGGGLYGLGAGNLFRVLSMAVKGWAVQDVPNGSTGTSRVIVEIAELDNCEKGISVNNATAVTFEDVRFVCRYQTSPNASAVYWPTNCIDIGAGTSPACSSVNFNNISYRLESGGLKANLGKFITAAAGTWIASSVYISAVLDNAAFGITGADIIANIGAGCTIRIVGQTTSPSLSGIVIYDNSRKPLAKLSYSTLPAIINSGAGSYAAASGIIALDSIRFDFQSNASASAYSFTIPYSGQYYCDGCVEFPAADGTRTRLAILQNRGGVYSTPITGTQYANGASTQTYRIFGIGDFQAGDILYLSGDQSTAGAINMSPTNSAAASVYFEVRAL